MSEPVMENKTELQMLKERAAIMGITHSNNISVETLREKIEAKMAGEPDTDSDNLNATSGTNSGVEPNPLEMAAAQLDERETIQVAIKPVLSLRDQLIADQMKLVRLRISNLDPKKADLPGEIITVANEVIGTVRKFIPFGEYTDDGYHVPYILYNFLKERKFLSITIVKDKRTGVSRPVQKYVKEFSLEVLEPLTKVEIERLATAQVAAGSFDHEELGL